MIIRWFFIGLIMTLLLVQAAAQHWRSDWVDELVMDEWPVDEDRPSGFVNTGELSRQEEQELDKLDQEIVVTLQDAFKKIQENQPVRVISLEEATTRLLDAYTFWALYGSYLKFILPFISMMVIVLMLQKSSPQHHLPV
ncbi:hypothetical protein BC941DRAFT_441953 [Chlamydoabsidia padenii]|nr:hypothetical protein BC941DRAFT_441953 [Chlamydoabsidia padenii]